MPFSGFAGKAWVNQKTQANDYVRKHNPAILFNASMSMKSRSSHRNHADNLKTPPLTVLPRTRT